MNTITTVIVGVIETTSILMSFSLVLIVVITGPRKLVPSVTLIPGPSTHVSTSTLRLLVPP